MYEWLQWSLRVLRNDNRSWYYNYNLILVQNHICQPRKVVVRPLFPNTVSPTLFHAVNLTISIDLTSIGEARHVTLYCLTGCRVSNVSMHVTVFLPLVVEY